MPRKLLYNEIESAEEKDKKQAQEDAEKDKKEATTSSESSNTTGSDSGAPAAQDTGKVNVKEDSKTKAKTYEYKNLEGDVEVVVSPKTLKIVAGSTVRITGIGKYLSGFYYVMGRKVSISGSGAMQVSLSVVKTKFGDSLKGEPPIEIEEEDLIGDKDTTSTGVGSGGYSTDGGNGGNSDSHSSYTGGAVNRKGSDDPLDQTV